MVLDKTFSCIQIYITNLENLGRVERSKKTRIPENKMYQIDLLQEFRKGLNGLGS